MEVHQYNSVGVYNLPDGESDDHHIGVTDLSQGPFSAKQA
jgi:hypothetical protein